MMLMLVTMMRLTITMSVPMCFVAESVDADYTNVYNGDDGDDYYHR